MSLMLQGLFVPLYSVESFPKASQRLNGIKLLEEEFIQCQDLEEWLELVRSQKVKKQLEMLLQIHCS